MAIFQTFFLSNLDKENVFYDILERENAFLGYQTKKSKKSKNWHFYQGVNPWFWSKNGHFSNFFLKQFRQGKCLLRCSRKKTTPFYAIKTNHPKKRKIGIFPKGLTRSRKSRKIHIFPKELTHGFGPKMAIFPTFLYRQFKPWKCLLRYYRTKKSLSRLSEKEVQKVVKLTFFPRG